MRELLYCKSPFVYQRRLTREVKVGNVGVGAANPIRVQSMITCDTMDTEAPVRQTLELAAGGRGIGSITAPTGNDAANLEHIGARMPAQGGGGPLPPGIPLKPAG